MRFIKHVALPLAFILLTVLLFSCTKAEIENLSPVSPGINVLPKEKIIDIVSTRVLRQQSYQKYFDLNSPDFDPRVRDLEMADPILVTVPSLANPNQILSAYYIIYGILPSGQVLVTEAVDAATGEFIAGKLWIDEVVKVISPQEALVYARKVVHGINPIIVEPIFVQDPKAYSTNELVSWKYRISSVDANGIPSDQVYLVDPFQRDFLSVPELTGQHTSVLVGDFNHRIFSMKTAPRARGTPKNTPILEPLD